MIALKRMWSLEKSCAKPVTLNDALVQRAKEAVTGTIEVSIDADAGGNLLGLTEITRLRTEKPDGAVQTEAVKVTLERRLLTTAKP